MRTNLTPLALYANGNLGKSCLSTLVEVYALFFLTDVLGIAPGIAGSLLLISFVWDAMSDPLWGYVSDRLKRRWSTFTPHFLIGVPLTVVGFLLLFAGSYACAPGGPLPALLALLLFRSAYTIVDVPHNSLLVFISEDSEDRNLVAGLRILFSSLGRLAATALTAFMIQSNGTSAVSESFFDIAVVLSGIYILSLSLCAYSVRCIKLTSKSNQRHAMKLTKIASSIVANRNILVVFFLTAMNSVMTPVIAATIIYYSKYAFGGDSVGPGAVTLLTVAQGVSVLFWAWLTKRIHVKTRALVASYVAFAFAVTFGAFFASSTLTICITGVLAGFSMGGMFMLNWSMLADGLDQSEMGNELTVFGLYTSTNKIFHGVAQAYLGFVLVLFGFEAGSEQGSLNIDGIRTTVFALPIVGAILCLIGLNRYQASRAQ